ncbi:MAG TPA: hypothetical protein VMT54_00965, partial [Candidatus Cybelea sp.]|nr:hypothetical protein [Candidatus Cybelea sp.]
ADTATLVSKMTTQLNGKVSDFVAASNAARQADARRLSQEREQTARGAGANADQFAVLDLAGDKATHALLVGLQGPVPDLTTATTGVAAAQQAQLAKEFGKNTYDAGPLTAVAQTVGEIAKPKDAKEQLTTFFAFSKEIYGDLTKAKKEAESKASATPPPLTGATTATAPANP